MSENRSLSDATPDNQDEVVRRLRKRPFDEVYKEMERYSNNKGSSGTNVKTVQKILDEYGWTFEEFLDRLLAKMQSTEWNT